MKRLFNCDVCVEKNVDSQHKDNVRLIIQKGTREGRTVSEIVFALERVQTRDRGRYRDPFVPKSPQYPNPQVLCAIWSSAIFNTLTSASGTGIAIDEK